MKTFLSIVIILFCTLAVYSRSGHKAISRVTSTVSKNDSVNIRQLVAAQIENARKAQLVEKSVVKKAAVPVVGSGNKRTGIYFFNNMPGYLNAFYNTILRISYWGIISLLAALLIYLRGRLFLKKSSGKRSIKDNIKLLREEKLFVRKNPKLSKIRKEIGRSPATFNYSNERIARTAKDMNIAKGEILLAAKIKAHELNRQWSTR